MSPRRALAVLAVVTAALALPGVVHAASEDVSVTVNPPRIETELGRNVTVRARVTNRASSSTGRLIAHLNVLSLRDGVEVDPEDWSTHRTRYLGTIPAHGSQTIRWPVHAINTGRIALYVGVLPQVNPHLPPLTGRTVQLLVAERDTLNSGGILPLALGIPALLGAMAAGLRLARGRR
jgi:hypothetical protein